jgi:hypothetical protein
VPKANVSGKESCSGSVIATSLGNWEMTIKDKILPLANAYAQAYITFREPESRAALLAALDAADREKQGFVDAVIDRDSIVKKLVAENELLRKSLTDTFHDIRAENAALREALKHLEHNARKSGANMGLALDAARAALGEVK